MEEVQLVAENDFDPDPDHLTHIIQSNPDLDARFRDLTRLDERDIIHINDMRCERGRVAPNGDLTIFYRYFFTKYISIRQEVDAQSDMMERHASIFPFKTNSSLEIRPVAVASSFDGEFLREIREFVDYHFGNTVDVDHLKDLFLTNVDHFRRQHYQRVPSLRQLTRIIGLGANPWRPDTAPEFLSDYFVDFVRLNDVGAQWYRHFQTKFNSICNLYGRETLKLPEKSEFHFKYLPEINCCELLLLLEPDFYQQSQNRRRYTDIFKKYLFFFGHAVRSSDPHPVWFIDEALFKCLQFKKRYETFRGDILELQWELWMMTLVHRRKHPLPTHAMTDEKPDEDNLRRVMEYADQIPLIKEAVVYYGEPQFRRFKIFAVFYDVAFLIGYSRRWVGDGFSYGQILKSALVSTEIRTIKYYNAYLGLESRFEMPANKTEICDFIREQTELHRPAPLYPEKFLIQDLLSYFVKLPPGARN